MTPRAITNDELTKLRSVGQYSEVYAVMRVPNVIYTARLNGTPTGTAEYVNDMVSQISYDGGSGTLADVKNDMTILVGSTAGASDLGRCRVRKTPTASVFYIGATSDIEWVDNAYLTVIDDFDVVARHPFVIDGVLYIDVDIPYSDQHEDFDPVVNMGGHVVLEFSGDPVSIARDASLSYSIGSAAASYSWSAPGASSTSNMTTATPTITYNAAGHYAIYCTVTSENGKSFTGVRYVAVVDVDSLAPVRDVSVTEDRGGSQFSVVMDSGATLTDFSERAFVFLFRRDYYNGVRGELGYRDGENNVLAVGRIIEQGVSWNDELSAVSLEVANWQYWLEKIQALPVEMSMALNTPATWEDVPSLTVNKAVFHILHYRSTVSRIADFYQVVDATYGLDIVQSAATNLRAQIDEITSRTIFASLIYDRCGYGFLRVEPQVLNLLYRDNFAVVQTLTKDDWIGELSADLNLYTEKAHVALSGIVVPVNGTPVSLYSFSPGHIPHAHGGAEVYDKVVVLSQAQSNSLAGFLAGWANRKFDSLSVSMVGNNPFFTVAEYSRVGITIAATDNARGVEYDGYLVTRAIQYSWNANSGFMQVTVTFEDESVEEPSTKGDPPDTSGAGTIPTIPKPPVYRPPTFPPQRLPPDVENINHPTTIAAKMVDTGFVFTTDFDEDSPEWQYFNEGLELDFYEGNAFMDFVVCPSGALYAVMAGGINTGWYYVYRCDGLGGGWSKVYDVFDYDDGTWTITGLTLNPYATEEVILHIGKGNTGKLVFLSGTTASVSSGSTTARNKAWRVGMVVLNGNVYVYGTHAETLTITRPRIWEFTISGALTTFAEVLSDVTFDCTMKQAGDMLIATQCYVSGSKRVIIDPSDLSYTQYDTPLLHGQAQNIVFSPTGAIGYGAGVTPTFVPYSSDDEGVTLTSSGDITSGNNVFDNCLDDNRFIYANLQVYFFDGTTEFIKTGNLSYIAPLDNVQAMRFIE